MEQKGVVDCSTHYLRNLLDVCDEMEAEKILNPHFSELSDRITRVWMENVRDVLVTQWG